MPVQYSIVIDGHDLREAAKLSFAMALVSSTVIAVAILVLPAPFSSLDWVLIVAPVLVLSVVWIIVGFFAAVLYAGMALIGNLTGTKS